jgi:Rieske Fe-S protein
MTDLGSERIESSRRNVLAGLAAAGVALPLLAACGSGGDSTTTGSTGTTGTTGPNTGTTPSSAGGGAAGGGGGIKTSEIPVGGGRIFASQQVVVTQPSAGQFKAFSAICTHQGCPVTSIEGGTINCPCHGSQFSIADGSVKGGPAPRGLPQKNVTVTGDTLKVT